MTTTHARNGNEPGRLRVYHLALHIAEQVHRIFRRARCSHSLRDQALRTAESLVLNIAEGASHEMPGQKIRHYHIARASAGECLAALDLLQRTDTKAYTSPARRNVQMASRMLTSLIKQWEDRRSHAPAMQIPPTAPPSPAVPQ